MQDDKKEWLSALVDSQADVNDLNQVIASEENKDTWSRYHLIGDVMRDEASQIDLDLVGKIEAAIDEEPTVVSLAAHRSFKQRVMQSAIVQQSSRWIGKGAQFAVAASVALVTVISVQEYRQADEQSPLPVLQTVGPVAGTIEPVSLSSEETGMQDPRQAHIDRIRQQQRIKALLIDHEQQLRINPQSNDGTDN